MRIYQVLKLLSGIIFFSAGTYLMTLFSSTKNIPIQRNEEYGISLSEYLEEMCTLGSQTIAILLHENEPSMPFSTKNGIYFHTVNDEDILRENLHLIMTFLNDNDCIHKVLVLNSESIVLSNASILEKFKNTASVQNNLVLKYRENPIELSTVLQCIYLQGEAEDCNVLQPYVTCQHSSAIIQYMFHSNKDIIDGQPSLTIPYDKFDLNNILRSDFIIMKSGLGKTKFLITYHSPFYSKTSTYDYEVVFSHSIVPNFNMYDICETPSYRNRTLEEVFYKPPNNAYPQNFNLLDHENFTCNLSKRFSDIKLGFQPTSRFVLVIEMRYHEFYKRLIEVYEMLYRPFFKHIIYCGPYTTNNVLFNNLSHLEKGKNNRGTTSYECIVQAVRCGYDVEGYVLLSDDTILQYWNFEKLNVSGLYMQDGLRKIPFTKEKDWWMHWEAVHGIRALKPAMAFLKEQSDMEIKNFVSLYQENMQDNAVQSFADWIYLPKKYSLTYMKVGEILVKYGVYMEIATAYIFHGCIKHDQIDHNTEGLFYQVASDFGINEFYASHFKPTNVVFHPIKYSKMYDAKSIYSLIHCKYLTHLQTYLLNSSDNNVYTTDFDETQFQSRQYSKEN